jgi:hypothetical protein
MKKKMLVEECIPIKITELTRHGLLHPDGITSAKAVYGSQAIADLEVNCAVAEPFARLTYSWKDAQGEIERCRFSNCPDNDQSEVWGCALVVPVPVDGEQQTLRPTCRQSVSPQRKPLFCMPSMPWTDL